MIFDLVSDYADVLTGMPHDHPRYRILKLVDEAIRRDEQFIDRHRADYPQALFQCLWNRLRWHDAPDLATYYSTDDCRWPENVPPWSLEGEKAYQRANVWLSQKEEHTTGWYWVRSLRPPESSLGSGQGTILEGQSYAIHCVACFHLDDLVVSASDECTLRIRNGSSGHELHVLQGHSQPVTGVCVSKDDQTIISGSLDGTVRIWNAETGECLDCLSLNSGGITGISLSSEGRLLAASLEDNTVIVWNLEERRRQSIINTECKVYSVAMTADGKTVVCGTDLYVYVFSSASGQLEFRQSGVRGKVKSLAISGDGQLVAAGGEASSGVVVWKLKSGREILRLVGHTEPVTAVTFAQNGKRVVTCSADRSIRIWNVESGVELASHWVPEVVDSLAVSHDGRTIVCGNREGTCRQFAITDDCAVTRLVGHSARIGNVAFSPDGRFIASTELFEPTVRLWDGFCGQPRHQLFGHVAALAIDLKVQISPDSKRLLSVGGNGEDARLWDTETGRPAIRFPSHIKLAETEFSEAGMFLCATVTDCNLNYGNEGTQNASRRMVIDAFSGYPLSISPNSLQLFDRRGMAQRKPFQAAMSRAETVISDRAGSAFAWFNLPLKHLATPGQGSRWAGSYENHLCLIELVIAGIKQERPPLIQISPLKELPHRLQIPQSVIQEIMVEASYGAGDFDSVATQLASKDRGFRFAAIQSLAMVQLDSSQRRKLAPVLRHYFEHCTRDAETTAMEFFQSIPLFDRSMLPAVIEGLDDPRESRQLACLTMIGSLGAVAKPFVDVLLNRLVEYSKTAALMPIRDGLLIAISRIGLDAKMPFPVILKAIKHGDAALRRDGCEILDQLVADASLTDVDGSVPQLTELLSVVDSLTKTRITRILGQLGSAASDSFIALQAQLSDKNRELRRITAWALAQTCLSHKEVYFAAALLCLDNAQRRQTGAECLAKPGVDISPVEPLIIQALAEETDDTVRSLIAKVVSRLSSPIAAIPATLSTATAGAELPARSVAASNGDPLRSSTNASAGTVGLAHRLADSENAAKFNFLIHEARKLWTKHRAQLVWWQRFRCPAPPLVSNDGTGSMVTKWEESLQKYKTLWEEWFKRPRWHQMFSIPPAFPDPGRD